VRISDNIHVFGRYNAPTFSNAIGIAPRPVRHASINEPTTQNAKNESFRTAGKLDPHIAEGANVLADPTRPDSPWAAWQSRQLPGGCGRKFGRWDAFGIRRTGEPGMRFGSKLTLNGLLAFWGCLSLLPDRVAAAHFAGRVPGRRRQAKLPLRALRCASIPCSRRELRWRNERPMPEQQLGPQKLTASAPIPKPPATSHGAVVRVASVGEAVDDAPEANGRRAALAHCGHDLRGERVLDACQRRSEHLWCG
jgi:hypothetical protein